MTEADANDTTYTDGKEYAFTSALAKGVHTFLFRTTDTTSDAVQTATQTGPDNS
jgi:endoglucanase